MIMAAGNPSQDSGAKPWQLDDGQQQAGNVKRVGPVPVDMSHVKSLVGFLQISIAVLSLISYICIDSMVYCTWFSFKGFGFFATMSMSTFLTMLLWFVLESLMVCQKLNFTTWHLWEMVVLGIYGVLYFIAVIVIATQICGQSAVGAAVFFGFASVAAMGVYFYFSFREWKLTESLEARRAQQYQAQQQADQPPPYTPADTMTTAYPL
ncbi:CKLF-like MARVEL transmembrane domain-containing protein 4 [Littorina saxatilis]|uniref:MARVEL domain-containing protein n=1 Tax=Littorina saxatilis TaxID=31220 RepID=A0AAN9C1R9_9CAEN